MLVLQLPQAATDLRHQRIALGWRHNTVLFPAQHVQVQPVETQRIRARPRPVHVREPAARFARGIKQVQVAVLMQPGVDADLAPERCEAVVGDDQKQIVLLFQ